MDQLTILIGGATGAAGRELVAYLSGHYPDVQIRAMTRNPDSEVARNLAGLSRVALVKGDYSDLESLGAAAEGVDRAFVACNNVAEQSQYERNFIDVCKGKGVGRIAKVSLFRYFCREGGPGPGGAHYEIEQHLSNSGVDHVILHPAYYFQDLFYFAQAIKMAGIIPQLLGDSKINMVDCRDVAQFAAALLTCDDEAFAPFNRQHVEIAGPEKLGGEDWARTLRDAGVAVRYEKVSPEAFKGGLLSVGVPEDMAAIVTDLHRCFYDGSAQIEDHATTPGLGKLPGVPKELRRFEAFVREAAPVFQA